MARVSKKTIGAVVTIKYSTNAYSIMYRDSENLSYGDGRIHNRYNGWVMRLRTRIDANLSAL